MAEVKIEGLETLYKQLLDLPAKIEQNLVRDALRAGEKVFLDAAKSYVPVKSGDLRNSLRIVTGTEKGQVTSALIAGDKKAFYAHMVEFGTSAHLIKPKNKKSLLIGGKFAASADNPGAIEKPFMRPAFDAGYSESLAVVSEYIREHLPEELAK